MPIDHFVVVMMENRSFDHYFGWLGETGLVDGLQQATYLDPQGNPVETRHASSMGAAEWQGCGHPDPGHGWGVGPRTAQRRLHGRRKRQRRVRADLLRRGRTRLHPRRRERLHGLRPLVLLAARADLAEPLLQVVGAVRRAEQQQRAGRDARQPVGDDLRRRAAHERDGALLQLGPAVLGDVRRARRSLDATTGGVLRRRGARRSCRTSPFVDPPVPRRRRLRRQLGRRAPARRRPPRTGLDGRRRQGVRRVARTTSAAHSSSSTTSGAASSTTSRRRACRTTARARTSTRTSGRWASGSRR